MFTTFMEARAFLQDEMERSVIYKTKVVRKGLTHIVLIHHDTVIVEYFADGSYILNNGGFETKTTKERLNRFTPFTITGSTESGWTGQRPKNWTDWRVELPNGESKPFNTIVTIGKMETQNA